MNKRENIISLYKRKDYEFVPVSFNLCPSLVEEYIRQTGDKTGNYQEYFDLDVRTVDGFPVLPQDNNQFKKYYGFELREGSTIDNYGVAHMPGSEAAMHMTEMVNPMEKFTSVKEMKSYPFPTFDLSFETEMKKQVIALHEKGYAVCFDKACTIWEGSWYMRGMENLMCDMLMEDEMATYLLDKITAISKELICSAVRSGVDMVHTGDDIGMQSTIMMSKEMYRKWLKPRLTEIISAAKAINPDVIIIYHSCGFVEPFIEDLAEAGVDVLNPVQPECMDFGELHAAHGDKISFNGTLGTQTTMPFGTPEEVSATTIKNLDIAGAKGGLVPCPTHLLEPEVPWANIMAFVEACRGYKK